MTRVALFFTQAAVLACGLLGALLLGCAALCIVLFERGLAARGAAR